MAIVIVPGASQPPFSVRVDIPAHSRRDSSPENFSEVIKRLVDKNVFGHLFINRENYKCDNRDTWDTELLALLESAQAFVPYPRLT